MFTGKMFTAAAGLLAMFAAGSVMATPTSLTVDGAVYTMGYSVLSLNDYKFTLNVDLANYTGVGSYLDGLAFKVGSSATSFAMLSTPDGVGNWTAQANGLDAGGCSKGSGQGFVCFMDTSNSGKGYAITSLSHTNQFVFEMAGSALTSSGVELKALYLNDNGRHVGSLVSMPISPVPEPDTSSLIFSGLGLLGFLVLRKRNS